MSTSSGRHSGCSTRRASRRDRPDPWGTICLLPGLRHAADEGRLPNARTVRARPVVDLVADMELDRAARVRKRDPAEHHHGEEETIRYGQSPQSPQLRGSEDSSVTSVASSDIVCCCASFRYSWYCCSVPA